MTGDQAKKERCATSERPELLCYQMLVNPETEPRVFSIG